MSIEEALVTLDAAFNQKHLNDLQELVFRQAWEGRTYKEIAETFSYDIDYIKHVGSQLWKLLSKAFREKVTKSNFRSVLRRRMQHTQVTTASPNTIKTTSNGQNFQTDNKYQNWGEAIDVPVFYGRNEELATLEQCIMSVSEAPRGSEARCRRVPLLNQFCFKYFQLRRVKVGSQGCFTFLIFHADSPLLDITLKGADTYPKKVCGLLFVHKAIPTNIPKFQISPNRNSRWRHLAKFKI